MNFSTEGKIILVIGFIILGVNFYIITMDKIPIATLSNTTPSITNLKQVYDLMWTTGVVSGGNLTFNSTGYIFITGGSAILRTSASQYSPLVSVNFSGANFTFTTDEFAYIALNYTNGTPLLYKTSNFSSINGNSQVTLYQVLREGTEINFISAKEQNVNTGLKVRRLSYDVHRYDHGYGGNVLSSPNGLNLSITAGTFYYGVNPIYTNAINTSLNDTFEYYYRNGSTWNDYTTNRLNTSHYDAGLGTPSPMGPNKYKVSWIFYELSDSGTGHVAIIFGQNQYSSTTAAQSDPLPNPLPPSFQNMGVMIGRVILQQGATAPSLIQTAFAPQFTFTTI